MQVLPWGKCVLPHADGGAVVDGVAELGQRHVQLVHRGQVFPRFSVTLKPGLLKLKLLWYLVSLLLVHNLNTHINIVGGSFPLVRMYVKLQKLKLIFKLPK